MNIIKKTMLTFLMAISLGAVSTVALAEDASVSETIVHVEKALEEVNKSDFSAARLHLKAARSASEKISGHDDIVKKANASVIQGQIQSNKGDVKKAAEELNKALVLYKSL
ncbi:MAG: hypothetical protein PHH59_10120 [Methylovulum sp.]|uniref:hypothetical protein n=1 Tax=Methylovulum sp. TaxID=1916980 RepID=UPI00261497E7|nr:hypothetical protein [Methylovulum sp.]MDD2724362.1 hypothetical protein [Methylovulum sp.]MDD5126157.1 hypothetical protein [Methylovulum sp.]